MKIFAFYATLSISHPIESTYEKTCSATCTGVTKNWTSYKSSDGYGVTTTGKRFDVQITWICDIILCFQLISSTAIWRKSLILTPGSPVTVIAGRLPGSIAFTRFPQAASKPMWDITVNIHWTKLMQQHETTLSTSKLLETAETWFDNKINWLILMNCWSHSLLGSQNELFKVLIVLV